MTVPRLVSLHLYPVKGLRPLHPAEARVERLGLDGDRRWAVMRPDGRALTQRDLPGMARIDAQPIPGGLRLSCDGQGDVDALPDGPAETLTVWGTAVPTVRADGAASLWLSCVLDTPCTLVHMHDPTSRRVTPDLARPGDVVSLADGFPLLVVGTASLAALNARLPAPVPMGRFRPNLVLETAKPWEEGTWSHLVVNGVRLRLASACVRCTVVTLDQVTGAATPRKEPLRTLGLMHRNADGGITFGWNAVPEALGTLRVGDTAEPILRP